MAARTSGKGASDGLVVRNPADRRQVVGFAPSAERDDVARTVGASQEAFVRWSAKSMKARRKALLAIADSFEVEAAGLARSLTMEVGKPLAEAKAEVAGAAATLRYYANLGAPERIVTKKEGTSQTYFEREPYGVCGLILPWNYPLVLLSWKLAPALLAGNTLVAKPSEHAPLTVAAAIGIASRSLPDGVASVLCGGDEVGSRLVQNPGVARIAVTGSPATGPKVLEAAAGRMAKVSLELGGNDPMVVMDDVDLGMRFEQIFWSSMRNCGQVCVAAKRVYVHRSIFPKFVKRYATRVEKLRIGNGLDPGIELGPVNNEAQLRKVQSLVRRSMDAGGKLEAGGRRLGGALRHGLFYEPAVVTGLDSDAPLVREEQFGPAVPIISFDTVDDAIEMANDSMLALGASVWSGSRDRAASVARRLAAGIVWVNSPLAVDITAPFGGFRGSGIGRELGVPGFHEYSSTKTYVVR